MDFNYNRYELTNGAIRKAQKAEIKEEPKEEPQRGAVAPEAKPSTPVEDMTGSEALASINRVMVNNPRGTSPQEPTFGRFYDNPETNRTIYVNKKQEMLTRKITVDDVENLRKLIKYAEYLKENFPGQATEYENDINMLNNLINIVSSRGGDRGEVENNSGVEPLRSGLEDELINGIHGGRAGDDGTVKGDMVTDSKGPTRADNGATGNITFDELLGLSNQIWSKVQELLNEFQIDFNVTEFGNIYDGPGHDENNRPYQEVLYNLGQQNISEDDITELRDLVLKFEDMISNYHVMNPNEPLDKLKHPIFMGIAECILAPRGLY